MAFCLAVPRTHRHAILKAYHDSLSAGHRGRDKTLALIRQRYWWETLAEDVENWVLSCETCQSRKRTNTAPSGFLRPLPIPPLPMYRIHIDFMGPIPTSDSGKSYIFTFSCGLTGWTETYAAAVADAATAIRAFERCILARWGTPCVVVSDNGTVYTAHVVREFLAALQAKHIRTSAYHPQSNSRAERPHAEIWKILSAYVNEEHRDWDVYLPYVTFALNCSIKQPLNDSPFFLMHGFDPRRPLDVALHPAANDYPYSAASEYRPDMLHVVAEARRRLQVITRKLQARNRAAYNDSHRDVSYRVGELVWLYTIPRSTDGKTAKLLRPWRGPFRIVSVASNLLNYRLAGHAGIPFQQTVHISRLKPYYSNAKRPDKIPLLDWADYFDFEKESATDHPDEIIEELERDTSIYQPSLNHSQSGDGSDPSDSELDAESDESARPLTAQQARLLSTPPSTPPRPAAKPLPKLAAIKPPAVSSRPLPAGWTHKTVTRQSGKTAGRADNYWTSPDGTQYRSWSSVQHRLQELPPSPSRPEVPSASAGTASN